MERSASRPCRARCIWLVSLTGRVMETRKELVLFRYNNCISCRFLVDKSERIRKLEKISISVALVLVVIVDFFLIPPGNEQQIIMHLDYDFKCVTYLINL